MIDFDPHSNPNGGIPRGPGSFGYPTPPPPPRKSAAWIFKTFFFLAVLGTLAAGTVAVVVFWRFSAGLPNIITVADYRPHGVTRIFAGNAGTEENLIGEFTKERRYLIPYEKIPQLLVRAFISAEDDKFFEHPGINISSIIRAGIANFRAGHVVQGGSTITQQVAKSLLLTPERSMTRKIREVILASRIERNLTKAQILYLYLNQIYLGHGAYGVQAASKTYFNKDVSDLTLAESAILAGLPQAPTLYSPLLNPKKAKERQLYVLKRMMENKYISPAQMSEAASQPVKLFGDQDLNTQFAPYFVEHLRRHLVEHYGDKAVYEEGLTVFVPTTKNLSETAKKSLREGLEAIDKRTGYRGAIKVLGSQDETAEYLAELRIKMIDRRIHHKLLMPDGHADWTEAMKEAGITDEQMLVAVGQNYEAVVTGVDDKKKIANVMIGSVKAELPMEAMKWARAPRDEKNPKAPREEPRVPSRVVKRHDVILVKVTAVSDKGVLVALEQEPQVQGALFSLETQTGYVLAMDGGYDFDKSEFNRAVQAQRQPGSSFKPLIYAAALEKGYTPASIIVDSPIIYEDSETGKWKPDNYESKFYGDTTFRQALIKSRNVPTIKIVQSIQVPYVLNYAKRLGLTGQFNADLSLSLGSGSTSLVEMTKLYSLFPRLGRKITPIFLTKVVDRDGRVLEEHSPQPFPSVKAPLTDPSPMPAASAAPVLSAGGMSASAAEFPTGKPSPLALPAYPLPEDPDQVLDPRVAYVMTHLMKEVVNYGTGHAAKSLGRPAAGKTGTTNDSVDAWFMGFTPQVVTGVWVGYDSQKSIGPAETGARAALPIWLNFMHEAVKPYPEADFTIPPGVIFASIDAISGKLAPPNASSSIKEAFIEGTEPTQAADPHGKVSPENQSQFFKEDTE